MSESVPLSGEEGGDRGRQVDKESLWPERQDEKKELLHNWERFKNSQSATIERNVAIYAMYEIITHDAPQVT